MGNSQYSTVYWVYIVQDQFIVTLCRLQRSCPCVSRVCSAYFYNQQGCFALVKVCFYMKITSFRRKGNVVSMEQKLCITTSGQRWNRKMHQWWTLEKIAKVSFYICSGVFIHSLSIIHLFLRYFSCLCSRPFSWRLVKRGSTVIPL